MREALEEFGGALLVVIVGSLIIAGITYFTGHSGIIAQFADAYSDYFYGA